MGTRALEQGIMCHLLSLAWKWEEFESERNSLLSPFAVAL